MSFPAAINFGQTQVGITGQLLANAKAVEQVTLPALTSQLALPLPVGSSPAAFVAVSALAMQDLTVKLSTAVGATVLTVPAGNTIILYGVTALYVSSVLGGQAQVIFG